MLFDTLIQQLAEPELEAVLAHEIGHFKKKHIPKMLLVSALGSLAGFWLISLLAQQEWFYRALRLSRRAALCRRCCCSGCCRAW